jgi:hypothetical protein
MDDERRGHRVDSLMVEAFVAAGPRKSLEEYKEDPLELCEDTAGYLSLRESVVFWVCDGTSNDDALPALRKLPGFNSRILAADLGQGFANLCAKALLKGTDPKSSLPKTLFGGVCTEWERRLVEYVSVLESGGKLDGLLSQLPEMGDGSYRLKWSSMLLGGIYNTGDHTLDILSIGDCGAVVVGEAPQIVAAKETCGIILATVTRPRPIKVEVFSAEVDSAWERYEGVTGFIAMSDGVSKDLDGLLTKLQESLSKGCSIGDIRARLIADRALTYDDRCVIIGRLLPCEEKGSESHTEGWLANALLPVRRAFGRKVE